MNKYWKNLKLGIKIGIGFGGVIIIMIILGTIVSWYMSGIKEQSMILDQEHVPGVSIANNIERSLLQAMYDIGAYGLTGESEYLEKGKSNLSSS